MSWTENQSVILRDEDSSERSGSFASRCRFCCWCFCGPGSGKALRCNEERPSHQFADCECDKLALGMISEIAISKHSESKCSNILHTGTLMKRKKGFQKRARQSFDAREYDLSVQSTLIIFRNENWIQNKMPVQIQTSILDLNSGRIHGVSPIRTVESCSRWLCESKKEDVKQPLVATQQSFVVKAFEEAGFSNTSDNVQLFRTRLARDAFEEALCHNAKTLPNQGSMIRRSIVGTSNWSRSGRIRLRRSRS